VAETVLLEAARPGETAEEEGAEPIRPKRSHRSAWPLVVAFAVYGAVALLANYPTWPGDPSRLRAGDLDMMVWFLAWTPHAIGHWQNPFATDWLNYPGGVNLSQNTAVPLLGLLTAPLTLAVNPIASVNLLLWLAFPLSAFSMFVVLRRWVRWDVAAFVGGALYGFSPYMVTQGQAHLHMAFVPLPPLILLAAYETVRPGADRPLRWGVALGALVVAQFFISPEVAATSLLVVVLCAIVLAVADPRSVGPALRKGGRALVVAGGIVIVVVAYPVWMMTHGPYSYRGPAFPGGVSADFLTSVTPTPLQMFTPGRIAAFGAHLDGGNLTENASYIGIPLLLLLIVVVGLCWRNRWIRFAAVLALLMTILSLGSHLVVDNHVTPVPLPWDVLQHLPFAGNVIVARLSLYTALFASLLLALGMADLRDRWRGAGDPAVRHRRRRFDEKSVRWVWACVLGVLGVVAAFSWIPAWPLETSPTNVPAFFSSPAVNRIPYGGVVLISPYPSVAEVQPQAWQAVAKMRFRMIGGYVLVAGANGDDTPFPQVLPPTPVQRFLWAEATGGPAYPVGPVPGVSDELACQLRSFLLRYRVDAVISTAFEADPQAIDALYSRAMGPPSYTGGGVTAWFDVRHDVVTRGVSCAT
jgi:hypothetical protein